MAKLQFASTLHASAPILTACYTLSRQPVPADIVGHIICGISTLVLKTQHTLYLSTVSDALNVARTETKAKAENTAQTLDHIKQELNLL
jgi:hypothetical protein